MEFATLDVSLSKPLCQYCEKTFSNKYNLSKHLRVVHKVGTKIKDADKLSYICKEWDCKARFPSVKQLRDHLSKIHSMTFDEQYLEFENLDAFYLWKNQYEEEQDVNFIKVTGVKRLEKGGKRLYFYCHRSGHANHNQNSVKMKHSSHKLGFNCTSTITVTENLNGQVICILYPIHYGHSKEIETLRLTEKEKEKIASKLSGNVCDDSILKEVHEDLLIKDKPSRIRLATKQTLRNIRRKYNIKPQRRQKEAVSVKISAKLKRLIELTKEQEKLKKDLKKLVKQAKKEGTALENKDSVRVENIKDFDSVKDALIDMDISLIKKIINH